MASVRRDAISIFNIICVLGMLIFNATSGVEPILKERWQEILYVIPRVSFSFIFEAFIFSSGLRLFFNRYDKMTWDTFYVNRLFIVALPYVICSLIYYGVFYFMDETAMIEDGFFLLMIKGEFTAYAYFILVLVQFYLLMPFVRWLLKKANHIALVITVLILSVGLSAVSDEYSILVRFFPQYLVFFIGGALAAIYYKELKTFVREKKGIVLGLFFLMLVIYEGLALLEVQYITSAARVLYSLSAIVLIFMIGTVISDARYLKSFILQQIDKSSYFIFMVHGLIIYATDIVLNDRLGISKGIEFYAIRICSAIVVTVLVSIVWRYIKNVFLLKLDR